MDVGILAANLAVAWVCWNELLSDVSSARFKRHLRTCLGARCPILPQRNGLGLNASCRCRLVSSCLVVKA